MIGALLRLRHRLAHLVLMNKRDLFFGSDPNGHNGLYFRCAGCFAETPWRANGGCQCAKCLPRRAS